MIPPRLIHGECLATMRQLAAEGVTVSAIVTDPPYDLPGGFMAKAWDRTGIAFLRETWAAAFDLLPPGGHLIAFGGTRTYHRMASAAEAAGFEIRDQLAWLFGTGFPKSLDIGKALDKAAGAEREIVGTRDRYRDGRARNNLGNANNWGGTFGTNGVADVTSPATEAARQWDGWGSALKPGLEPILLARKPLAGTLAANTLAHGVGGINVEACRIGTGEDGASGGASGEIGYHAGGAGGVARPVGGRFPANVLHDGSEEVEAAFAAFGERSSGGGGVRRVGSETFGQAVAGGVRPVIGDTGTPSRFYYCAKASKAERNGSTHVAVKPLALMRWLVRLVTPPGGTVLDPFAGTGTTLAAAMAEGFGAIGIEQDAGFIADAQRRIAAMTPGATAKAEELADDPR